MELIRNQRSKKEERVGANLSVENVKLKWIKAQ